MQFKSVDYGEIAYKAYGDYVEWKNFQGNLMPKYEELPQKIREAWGVAARKVMGIMNEYNMQVGSDD